MKKLFALLALLLLTLLGVAPAAVADTPTDIVVEDTAGVLYLPELLAAVERIDFYEPTKVAIVTQNGVAGSDTLNEDVLRFARENHPEWLSGDGQKWADGLFIFAVDPIARKVGTYLGEDRKVSTDTQLTIQQESGDLFRDAQWTEGTIAGVEKAASYLNRPWYRSPLVIVGGIVAVVGSALTALTVTFVRRKNRDTAASYFKTGDASYASVSFDLEVTELNANTIPPQSPYGALVLEKYRTFNTRYGEVTALNERAHLLSAKELSRKANLAPVKEYSEAAEELDGLDDVIADTNTLLNKFSGWEAAWDRQVEPLRLDLKDLAELPKAKKQAAKASDAALHSFAVRTQDELERWGSQLSSGTLTPEAALDLLREARTELSRLLDVHGEALIDQYAKTGKEAKAMRSAMDEERQRGATWDNPNILGSVYGMNSFYAVSVFSHGYSSAASTVDSDRSAASGSSTGYGGSGGSFSGSGSSSSF